MMTVSINNLATYKLYWKANSTDRPLLNAIIENLHNATRPLRPYEVLPTISPQKATYLLGLLVKFEIVRRDALKIEYYERKHRDGTITREPFTPYGYTLIIYEPDPVYQPPRYVSIETRIARAQTTADINAILEHIERLEFQADMSDDYRTTLKELSECQEWRRMLNKRAKMLGL